MRLDINMRRRRWPTMLVVLAIAIAACSAGPGPSASDATVRVVATTTVFADIVANVGGDRVTVRSIIPAGVGPEDYEPKPERRARRSTGPISSCPTASASTTSSTASSRRTASDAPRLVLGDGIPTIAVDGDAEPAFLARSDARRASDYLPAIEAKLSEIDPAGAATYRANAAAYAAAIAAMDAELLAEVATIPAANRKLVTFHDAFPYFARHYGFELVGVILGESRAGAVGRRARRARGHGQGGRREGRLQRGPVQPGTGRDAGHRRRASRRSSRPCITMPSARRRPTPTWG